VPGSVLRTQPAAQHRQIQRTKIIMAGICQASQQCGDIAPVGAHGMHGQPSHGCQVGHEALSIRRQALR